MSLLNLSHTGATLRWRHNGRDGVSNHQPHVCLLNRLFRRRSKRTSKLRVTGLCAGNSPGPVNSPHKWPVTRKMFPFDDVIMITYWCYTCTEENFFKTSSILFHTRFKFHVFVIQISINWELYTFFQMTRQLCFRCMCKYRYRYYSHKWS